MKPRKATIEINSLTDKGQGIGEYEGKEARIWDAYPGEKVEALIFRKKPEYYEGMAEEIIRPSKNRVDPEEDHFFICSPWQSLSWEQEIEWKKKIAIKAFEDQKITMPSDPEIEFQEDRKFGYRSKLEFSFWGLSPEEGGKISLAFFKRGRKQRIPINGCKLGSKNLNETAHIILDWINEVGFSAWSLKSLMIRNNSKGDTIAGLFVKEELKVKKMPVLPEFVRGFNIYFSDPRSPASVSTDLLYSQGEKFISENIEGVELRYDFLSFFQTNSLFFKKAVRDIGNFVEPSKNILDFYSGVGAIGLPLSKKADKCILVESNEISAKYAQENIRLNKLENCEAIHVRAENAVDYITGEETVIFDPPRAGLHINVINRVLDKLPERIIYLSCNITTQTRDIKLIADKYSVSNWKLYNFFPRTPHVESLCILDKKR